MLGLKGAKQEVQANVLNGKCCIGGYTCSNELRIVGWQHKHQDKCIHNRLCYLKH